MFRNCNHWCLWHGTCVNTCDGECKGLEYPKEEQNDSEEKLEHTTY